MISIAIVDDNPFDANKLSAFVKRYKKENELEFELSVFNDGLDFMQELNTRCFDIVFMDVYLKEGNIENDDLVESLDYKKDSDDAQLLNTQKYNDGIELSKELCRICDNCIVVFVTSSQEDIWRAVATNSCYDYIRKDDLNYEKVSKILKNIERKFKLNNEIISFLSGKKQIDIRVNQIMYVLSNDKYTNIRMRKGTLRYRILFSEICELLAKYSNFIECNRGILLNMDYIESADAQTFTMIDNRVFPVRRRDCSSILSKFYDYQFYLLNR